MANFNELIELAKATNADSTLLSKLMEINQTHEIIATKTLIELERDEAELRAYEFGGIDNWDWRYDSLKDHYVEPYPDEPGAREYD